MENICREVESLQSFKCEMCGKTFSNETQLSNHQLSHKQERLNECDLCQYSTTRISNLNKHRLTHTQEKPYQCNICEKSYKSPDSLKHHTVLHKDIFESKKVYDCTKCWSERSACASGANLGGHYFR